MHIYDSDNEKSLDDIILYLKPSEAQELYDDLARIIEKPRGNHAHVNSDDYKREITVCIYRAEDIDTFDMKSQQILNEEC